SKIRRETIDAWSERFGQRILVGYGLTETAPVISVNVPASNRFDTAGLPMPGIELRFTPVDGIADAGELSVRGDNVMLGYLHPSRPGELQPPPDGWFETGDVARLDPDGHLVIVDRLSRFAKVGGEKVSLDGLDHLASALWPGSASVSVALPDPRKGERIVLLTERAGATRQDLLPAARAAGLPEIALPALVLSVPELPLLGSGKPDLQAARRLAEQLAPVP
ncbi:MAG: AMP-binding protein, partial [Gluconacetobacter diazotrophicus]|nr:AMP-binding protein [Gluconacetobacter diazotrophicus]